MKTRHQYKSIVVTSFFKTFLYRPIKIKFYFTCTVSQVNQRRIAVETAEFTVYSDSSVLRDSPECANELKRVTVK